MSKRRQHSEEFKREAVKLVTEGGYTTAQAARSLGIHENLLRNWRHKYSPEEEKPMKDLTETEAQELARLREENRRLRMERDILKKSDGVLRERKELRFAFMEAHEGEWPVSVLCVVLEVSRSGYYAWRNRAECARRIRQRELVAEMRMIHGERHKGNYGSPRMLVELRARGQAVSENTVARLMREHGLRALTARKFRHTTDSNHRHPVAENVLNQEFEQSRVNQVWAGDITYILTREGWLYLACVLDLYSRKVVGWSMSERMTSELVISAMQMALEQRCPPARELLHHSDRGSQYASGAFQKVLAEHGITCSMSGAGNCYDNAMVESFFATLKKELVHQSDYRTREAARRSIFEWIEVFYNRERRHTALGDQSPCEYEEGTVCRSLEPHPQRQASELPSSPPVLGRHIEVSDRRPAPTKATPSRQQPAKST